MASIDLEATLLSVLGEILAYINADFKPMCENPEICVNSEEPINILIGIIGDLEGNILFGFEPETAKHIAGKLMGTKDLDDMDIFAEAALADFCAELCKRFMLMVKIEHELTASFPSYISGEEICGIIDDEYANKLFYKAGGKKSYITYNLEPTYGK